MYLDVVSDVHVDFHSLSSNDLDFIDWSNRTPNTDILINAGDDANRPSLSKKYLKNATKYYRKVIHVDGNHHHYSSNAPVDKTMDEHRKFSQENPNIIYLDGTNEYLEDGVLFIGANGWYDFNVMKPQYTVIEMERAWYKYNNDSSNILFDKHPIEYAQQHAKLLREHVIQAQDRDDVEKIVIITHTIPVKNAMVEKPTSLSWTLLFGSFVNTLMETVIDSNYHDKIKLWVFGHTHYTWDFDYKGIRFFSNPRGYIGENPNWRIQGVEV